MASGNRYIEDIRTGESWTSDPVHISAEDIIQFGRLYDPQPMHTDIEAAATGPFGGLIASGWQMASLAMRLSVEARVFGDTPIIGAGVDELRWRKPVRAGDSVTVTREIIEVVMPAAMGACGTVRTRMVMRNQHGEDVMRMTVAAKVPARPG
jgi:acyl dehydratase